MGEDVKHDEDSSTSTPKKEGGIQSSSKLGHSQRSEEVSSSHEPEESAYLDIETSAALNARQLTSPLAMLGSSANNTSSEMRRDRLARQKEAALKLTSPTSALSDPNKIHLIGQFEIFRHSNTD